MQAPLPKTPERHCWSEEETVQTSRGLGGLMQWEGASSRAPQRLPTPPSPSPPCRVGGSPPLFPRVIQLLLVGSCRALGQVGGGPECQVQGVAAAPSFEL